MTALCEYHEDYANEICPDCNLQVDGYGNTEDSFKYCSFPDCGCDGARLCMAGEASENAIKGNVENMWSNGSNKAAHKAVMYTIGLCTTKQRGLND